MIPLSIPQPKRKASIQWSLVTLILILVTLVVLFIILFILKGNLEGVTSFFSNIY
ncbi:hypothetical protein HYW21_03360 [Candidatus Woesearchaeota archaeon]|nr:hypothetical protein [Candidatus Woesearchaeota archaeon]